MGHANGLSGDAYGNVADACTAAMTAAADGDSVFIGGSNYVVSEIPESLRR